MKNFIHTPVNTPKPVKINTVAINDNHGKYFVIAPREATELRNRVFMVLRNAQPSALLLDSGQFLDINADIEVLPVIQIELKYWI